MARSKLSSWINRLLNGWMAELKGWMDGWIDDWLVEKLHRLMPEHMTGWLIRSIDDWMDS